MTAKTGQTGDAKRTLKCLSPLLCPALGFILGVTLSMFLPKGELWSFCGKLFMVCYGLVGWAIAVCFVQQKRLFCGATETITPENWPGYSQRYGVGLTIVVGGLLLGVVGLLGAAANREHLILGLCIYFFCLPTTFAVMVGEMGWEDPLKFFKGFRKA